MNVETLMQDPVVLLVTSALLGMVVIFIVTQLFGNKATTKSLMTPVPTSTTTTTTTTTTKSSNKKKNKKKKAAAKKEPVVEDNPASLAVKDAAPAATEPAPGSKQKKNKKSSTNGTSNTTAKQQPEKETANNQQAAPKAASKTKKKRNKKQSSAAISASDPPPEETIVLDNEDDDDDEDDDDLMMLATFAKGGRTSNKKKAADTNNSNNKAVPGEWKTIAKKTKGVASIATTSTETNAAASTTATETIALEADQVPLLLGPKGATIQQMQTETGAKLDVDKTTNQVVVSGSPTAVLAAVQAVQSLLDRAAKGQAHTVTLAGTEINGTDGCKAIIGRAGTNIQKIEAACPECRIKANIELGTVVISGPTEQAVAAAVQLCKNAVWGESNVTIELGSRSMVTALCGRTFTDLQQYQKDTHTRMDVTGTTLTIRGDTDKVRQAQTLMQQKVALYEGVTLNLETAKIGVIIGPKGSNLQKIQERTGAQVEVNQLGDGAECKIIGDPKAVQAARVMVDKLLSGEVELRPGEGRITVELGVGASAVIGRGGSTIAELERKYGVKLNVQNAVCSIVGKKDKLPTAKNAIEEIVKPLIQKAAEEAKIREQAEAMATNGNKAWSMPEEDDLAGW